MRQEFEDYLKCGLLQHGFLRVKCDGCRCGARRMVESAAHLVDHVFPEAPVRQWVLTFPFTLRFLLAAEPQALTAVLAVVQRAISTFVIRHAGLTVASGARTGAVTLIQRFGSALNLNPHLHMLFLDGAYTFRGCRATFHRARRPQPDELLKLLDSLSRRIVRLLERRRLLIADPEHPALALEVGSPLDQIQAASVHYRIAIGPHAGRKVLTLHSVPPLHAEPNNPLLARLAGLSLHAATVCEAYQRSRLKRVFQIDIETCPECGGTLRVIACIEDPPLIRTILTHVQRRAALTPSAPRGPPDSQPVLSLTQSGWVASPGLPAAGPVHPIQPVILAGFRQAVVYSSYPRPPRV